MLVTSEPSLQASDFSLKFFVVEFIKVIFIREYFYRIGRFEGKYIILAFHIVCGSARRAGHVDV